MKLVVQRVTDASVKVDNSIVGEIGAGLMVLVGFGQNDTTREADFLARKLIKLRIFADENGDLVAADSTDGIHLGVASSKKWAEYLRMHPLPPLGEQ